MPPPRFETTGNTALKQEPISSQAREIRSGERKGGFRIVESEEGKDPQVQDTEADIEILQEEEKFGEEAEQPSTISEADIRMFEERSEKAQRATQVLPLEEFADPSEEMNLALSYTPPPTEEMRAEFAKEENYDPTKEVVTTVEGPVIEHINGTREDRVAALSWMNEGVSTEASRNRRNVFLESIEVMNDISGMLNKLEADSTDTGYLEDNPDIAKRVYYLDSEIVRIPAEVREEPNSWVAQEWVNELDPLATLERMKNSPAKPGGAEAPDLTYLREYRNLFARVTRNCTVLTQELKDHSKRLTSMDLLIKTKELAQATVMIDAFYRQAEQYVDVIEEQKRDLTEVAQDHGGVETVETIAGDPRQEVVKRMENAEELQQKIFLNTLLRGVTPKGSEDLALSAELVIRSVLKPKIVEAIKEERRDEQGEASEKWAMNPHEPPRRLEELVTDKYLDKKSISKTLMCGLVSAYRNSLVDSGAMDRDRATATAASILISYELGRASKENLGRINLSEIRGQTIGSAMSEDYAAAVELSFLAASMGTATYEQMQESDTKANLIRAVGFINQHVKNMIGYTEVSMDGEGNEQRTVHAKPTMLGNDLYSLKMATGYGG